MCSNLINYWEIWTRQADIPIKRLILSLISKALAMIFFDIDDHQIDHPIIANNKQMPEFPSMHS